LFFIEIVEVSGVFRNVFYVLRIGICNTWKERARKETPHEHMRIIHVGYCLENDAVVGSWRALVRAQQAANMSLIVL
jgi:hypothetical protein